MTTCQVCCDSPGDNDNDNVATTPCCQYQICSSCLVKYLHTKLADPMCLNCRHELPYSFILKSIPVDDFHRWLTNLMFSKDFSARNTTTQLIGFGNVLRAWKVALERLQKEKCRLHKILYTTKTARLRLGKGMRGFQRQYDTILLEISKLRNHAAEKANIIRHISMADDSTRGLFDILVPKCFAVTDAPYTPYHHKLDPVLICPSPECLGVIVGTSCSNCGIEICLKCKDPVHSTTKCNTDTVQSLKTIRAETKPCPNCNVPIVLAGGCNQMFCTQCHIAFDYTSGSIIQNGAIHNPHYYEWLETVGIDELAENDLIAWVDHIGGSIPIWMERFLEAYEADSDEIKGAYSLYENIMMSRLKFLKGEIAHEDYLYALRKHGELGILQSIQREYRTSFLSLFRMYFHHKDSTVLRRELRRLVVDAGDTWDMIAPAFEPELTKTMFRFNFAF